MWLFTRVRLTRKSGHLPHFAMVFHAIGVRQHGADAVNGYRRQFITEFVVSTIVSKAPPTDIPHCRESKALR
jgi:hypothetical protein